MILNDFATFMYWTRFNEKVLNLQVKSEAESENVHLPV